MKRPLTVGYRILFAIPTWFAAVVIGGLADKAVYQATHSNYLEELHGAWGADELMAVLLLRPFYSLIAGLNPWVLLIFVTFIGLIQHKSQGRKIVAVFAVTAAVFAAALGINSWLGGLPDGLFGNHLEFSTFLFVIFFPSLISALVLSPKASIDNHFQ